MTMNARTIRVSEDGAVVYYGNLVLSLGYSTDEGYEVLVEMDTDEDALAMPVTLANAAGDEITWEL